MASEDVLVIGAGPAGIASAWALEQAGISYKVVDQANVIASTWDRLYPSLRLNTSRFFSAMPGMRFALRSGIFPSGRDYHLHVREFVNQHNFNIHLGVDIQCVVPENGMWRVESSEGIHHYPAIISATGIWNNPSMPDIPGMDRFSGEMIHAHDFRDPHMVTGKRVLVVGNGPSGVDISIAASKAAKGSVLLAIRSGIRLGPRYPYGLPKHIWMMIGERLPERWCSWLMEKVNQTSYSNQEQYGLKLPDGSEPGSAIPYRGPELLHAVRDGKVTPVEAPICFKDDTVEFTDGSRRKVDMVIMATGYQPVLHTYLDIEMQYNTDPLEQPDPCEWELGPNGRRGWPLRDTSQHPNGRQVLGHPGLYLVGVFYKGKGAMHNFPIEAQIAAEQITAYLRERQRS